MKVLQMEGYQLMSEYKGVHKPVILLCPNKHLWTTTASKFRHLNQRCSTCPPRRTLLTKTRILELIESRDYILIGEYTNYSTHMELECPNQHHIHMAPSDFERGRDCAKCEGNCPLEAEKRLLTLAATEDYIISGKYVNNHTRIQALCSRRHPLEIIPNNFMLGSRCLKCPDICPVEFKENFLKLIAVERYTILGEYIDKSTGIEAKCAEQHPLIVIPSHFQKGARCTKCNDNCLIHAKESFLVLLKIEQYTLHSEYMDTNRKVKCIRHHPWEVTPNKFKLGARCPECPRKESGGEKKVREVLENLQINFSVQKIFSFLPNRRYDFSFTYNNIRFIIEFDGKQHFQFTSHFHNNDIAEFYKDQSVDTLKTQFALNNGHKMIRISYKEKKDIELHVKTALASLQTEGVNLYLSNLQLYSYLGKYKTS